MRKRFPDYQAIRITWVRITEGPLYLPLKDVAVCSLVETQHKFADTDVFIYSKEQTRCAIIWEITQRRFESLPTFRDKLSVQS